jgi:hypothetical protein
MYFCGNDIEGEECYAYEKSVKKWKENYDALL